MLHILLQNFFPGDELYEKMKMDTYKHYAEIVRSNASEEENRKSFPLLKITQSTKDLFHTPAGKTNRWVFNMEKGEYHFRCNTKLKYNLPVPETLFKNAHL